MVGQIKILDPTIKSMKVLWPGWAFVDCGRLEYLLFLYAAQPRKKPDSKRAVMKGLVSQ